MTTTKIEERKAETAQQLQRMLRENTGCSILDSGGHYGRNWQRNQNKDFESESVGWHECWPSDGIAGLCVTLSVYHWLLSRLVYNPYRQQCYEKWLERTGKYNELSSMEEYVDGLPDAAGIYGDGSPVVVNTYNEEDALSQIIQYVYWEDKDGSHVLLQIHGGCDARGGYTGAVWFDVNHDSELAIFANNRWSIGCPSGCVVWDNDGGRYLNDDTNGHTPEWESLEVVESQPEYQLHCSQQKMTAGLVRPTSAGVNTGKLWVDADRQAHCPCCGKQLEIWY